MTTHRLTLAAGGQISAETVGDGRGGDVVGQVGRATLTDGAQITSGSGLTVGQTSQVGTGAGGTIMVTATEAVALIGPVTDLFTRTLGAGQGGAITLQAPQVTLAAGVTLSAENTGTGNAGNITIVTQDRLR